MVINPHQTLQQYFGFGAFREGQEEAINYILKGQSMLLVMPTGAGKSLVYQLPALLLPGLTLVISPLIALMQDQVEALTEMGIAATYLNSSLSGAEIKHRSRAVMEGHVKLLYVAPERLRSQHFTRVLARVQVSLLAVDEAHCISQWGHDFRPDYLQIGPMWHALGKPTLLATTATATAKVRKDIVTLLDISRIKTIVTGFNRPNLMYRVKVAPNDQAKFQILQSALKNLEGSAIIYTATRQNAEMGADFVANFMNIPARPYHAGLDSQQRYQTQNDFMADRIKVVVATNAFGMGIDKPDIRLVAHYNMPATVEAYYQEAGRAGRDGLPAECLLLFAPDDQQIQRWFIENDTPTYENLHQTYKILSQAADAGEVFFDTDELSEMIGLPESKIRVVLNELELAGVILHLGQHGRNRHWKLLTLDDDLLRERARTIIQRARIRLDLLEKMISYVNLTSCRRNFLLDYFGDESPPSSPRCCDNHAEQSVAELPKAVTPEEWFPLIVLETVRSLHHRPVGRRRLAQLLTGSQAKGMKQFGYDQHKFYSKLDMMSQSQLIELVDSLLEKRYLYISGGKLPVLSLSPLGMESLKARVVVPVPCPVVESRRKGADNVHFVQKKGLPQTVLETEELFQKGFRPSQIAEERGLTERTIYNHLARLIGEERIGLHEIVPQEIEAQILQAIQQIGSMERLTPVKAVLPEDITFDQIKCVFAAHPDALEAKKASEERPSEEKPSAETLEPEQDESWIIALKEQGAVSELIEALQHHRDKIRRLAASALGEIGSSKAVEPLIQLLNRESETQVRQYAIWALGKIGDGRAEPILKKIAINTQEKKYLVRAAHVALANLSEADGAAVTQSDSSPVTGSSPAPEIVKKEANPQMVVLEAVAKLGGTLGRTGLAKFLTGSQVAWLEKFQTHSYYGRLSDLSQKAVLNILDALITEGQLKTTGGHRPKVILSENVPAPTSEEKKSSEPDDSPQKVDESPDKHETILTPSEAILAVVSDLDGLLTVQGLALLLTATSDDVAPFSDHRSFGLFCGRVATEEMISHIQAEIQTGRLTLSSYQRLLLPESQAGI